MIITTTATSNVAELYIRTLESFSRSINFRNYDCIINIDVYDDHATDLIDIANNTFKSVKHRICPEPNFTAAVQWCWSEACKTDEEWIFNLEPDWLLNYDINVDNVLSRGTKTGAVNLRAYMRFNHRFCLTPGFIKTSVVKQFINRFDTQINPEYQIQNIFRTRAVHYPKHHVIVEDTGRAYAKERGIWQRTGQKFFTKWENIYDRGYTDYNGL